MWAVIISIKFYVPELKEFLNIILFLLIVRYIISWETSIPKTFLTKPSEAYFLYKCTVFLFQICLFKKYVKIHTKYLSKPGHPISSKNILRCAVSIRPSNFTAPLYSQKNIAPICTTFCSNFLVINFSRTK